jgi:hypothetical protein
MLPFILGIAAIMAGTSGVALGITGAVDMANANSKINSAKRRDEENRNRFNCIERSTLKTMDALGYAEINAVKSLDKFSQLFEKIHNKPQFEKILGANVKLDKFTPNELKNASVGAAVLAGGLTGAALGTAGGFAAASITTSAVMALGTASTGTAISSLSGVAATNATLAALGGGSLAAGGGGMALGSTILGASTLGVGLLIGGIIFGLSGSSVSDKADKAYSQMLENERKINTITKYLTELQTAASSYHYTFNKVVDSYNLYLSKMEHIINVNHANDANWGKFTAYERMVIENTVLLVGIIYNMCKVKLVKKGYPCNEVNQSEITRMQKTAQETMTTIGM